MTTKHTPAYSGKSYNDERETMLSIIGGYRVAMHAPSPGEQRHQLAQADDAAAKFLRSLGEDA